MKIKKYLIPALIIAIVALSLAAVFVIENHSSNQNDVHVLTDVDVTSDDLSSQQDEIVENSMAPENQDNAALPLDKSAEVSENVQSKPEEKEDTSVNYIPEETAAPVISNSSDNIMRCSISIKCDNVLEHMDLLKDNKKEVIPADGVIMANKIVEFHEGETVFNVLQRETKKSKIHMEFTKAPIYNSAYIEGIANLYEFDCGNLSGWMYRVNGQAPRYGSSLYTLKDGDIIEWQYTCDLGRDVNGYTGE